MVETERGGITNPFALGIGVGHYDDARPSFHPQVMRRLLSWIGGESLDRAIDVGCGTGQSTEPLSNLSTITVGLDSAGPMLEHARLKERISYVRGFAEQMPFAADTFDLVTVGLAWHWFDQEVFMDEVRYVLRTGGWLLIYNDVFKGTMRENETFQKWFRNDYVDRYPAPRRRSATPLDLTMPGFRQLHNEGFHHAQTYDVTELIAVLMTHTNTIAAIHDGRESSEAVAAWLRAALEPLFVRRTGTFEYAGRMSLLERLDESRR